MAKTWTRFSAAGLTLIRSDPHTGCIGLLLYI